MKLKLLTATLVAATLVGCGGDGEDVFDVPASSSSSSTSSDAPNTPATFDGLSATVSNSTETDLEGRVLVSDPDDGESGVQALTDESTMYGTFSIDADGFWTYTLDTDASDVASLSGPEDTIVDEIEVLSTDGTAGMLEITITGGEIITTTRAAKITDDDSTDAGELRYKHAEGALEQGKLMVSFLKEADAVDTDGTAKDAYIGLYGTSTSTSNAIVDLRIQADQFLIRDRNDIEVSIPFVPGQWTDVEMTWDASDADDTQTPLVTVTINGQSVTTEPFRSAAGSTFAAADGVEVVVFKFGDDSGIIPDAAYYVDNIKLFSDKAGTNIVFEDDFEDRPVGQFLDPDVNPEITDYHGNTQWAIVADVPVEGTGGEDGGTGPGNAGNKIAKITDSMTDDAGELRYKRGDEEVLSQGKLSVYFLKDDNAVDESGNTKDAYIGLYGSSTSTSDAIIDLRIKSDSFEIRDQSLSIEEAFTPGEWMHVEMAWDASAASDTQPPTVTLWINGTEVAGGSFESASSDLAGVMNGVQTFVFKLGDNGSIIPDAAFHVDNIQVYADIEGTDLVFEDDFEARTVAESLDPDENPEITEYHSNTAEVVVAEEQ